MCGIFGTINKHVDIDHVYPSLCHRGPDEQGSWKYKNVQIHNFRLAIQDIPHGSQPMSRGPYTITFNGELYNHLSVRSKHNLSCQTNSDTETLLAAYEKLGLQCLSEFDGMFAFALIDTNNDELILVRDRAGKKPLYYYQQDNVIAFSSELNALKNIFNLAIDESHIYQYLRFGYMPGRCTPYKNVIELKGGHLRKFRLNNFKSKNEVKWWDINKFYLNTTGDNLSQATEKVDQLLHKAVKNRITSSDVEVGAFLSGGIDSGLITAIASNHVPRLKTFTVSFDHEYDETALARQTALKYATEHTEITINYNFLASDVEKIISNYGEPFYDSSAIPSYYISREAKKFIKVILNGDGADELFGGYRRYVPFRYFDFFNSSTAVNSIFRIFKKVLPTTVKKRSNIYYLNRLLNLADKPPCEAYLSITSDIFENIPNAFTTNPTFPDSFR